MGGFTHAYPGPHVTPKPARPAHRPSTRTLVFASVSSLMIGLAAGALWLLLVLAHPGPLATVWLGLPIGLALGWVTRHWVLEASPPAAVLAAASMLLAAAYMRFLMAAAELSGMFGIAFLQAFRRAGPGMLMHLTWLSLTPLACGIYVSCALLAAIAAVAPRRHGRDRG